MPDTDEIQDDLDEWLANRTRENEERDDNRFYEDENQEYEDPIPGESS